MDKTANSVKNALNPHKFSKFDNIEQVRKKKMKKKG